MNGWVIDGQCTNQTQNKTKTPPFSAWKSDTAGKTWSSGVVVMWNTFEQITKKKGALSKTTTIRRVLWALQLVNVLPVGKVGRALYRWNKTTATKHALDIDKRIKTHTIFGSVRMMEEKRKQLAGWIGMDPKRIFIAHKTFIFITYTTSMRIFPPSFTAGSDNEYWVIKNGCTKCGALCWGRGLGFATCLLMFLWLVHGCDQLENDDERLITGRPDRG